MSGASRDGCRVVGKMVAFGEQRDSSLCTPTGSGVCLAPASLVKPAPFMKCSAAPSKAPAQAVAQAPRHPYPASRAPNSPLATIGCGWVLGRSAGQRDGVPLHSHGKRGLSRSFVPRQTRSLLECSAAPHKAPRPTNKPRPHLPRHLPPRFPHPKTLPSPLRVPLGGVSLAGAARFLEGERRY